ncbi:MULTISPECIES: methyl-accepting chemotaxis protein [Shewanella]|uniref:Methyl-accepting chemotaxis protein n=1 Tax=Shewanella metallivivens TaxID=2872342 RepID=A0ABT5THV6_9GAMM|nr:methyl-accepting chemotaxis protein [Shewanella metallivivens]MDD8058193.1 methyl-accepting chemotaxis protein [Shewanella metallivivens]
MIELLRRLTILKRLFIMLILAAIGTVVFGSFSVKEQYTHLVEQQQKQVSEQATLMVNMLKVLQQQQQLPQDDLLAFIADIQISQYMDLLVVDNQNKVLFSTLKAAAGQTVNTLTSANSPSYSQLINGAKQSTTQAQLSLKANGGQSQTVLAAAAYLPINQFTIITQANLDQVNQSMTGIIIDYLIIMLFISVPIFAFFLLLNHSITQPLKEATYAMEQIAKGEGDLTQRLSTIGDDEVTKLADGFNQFVIKIADMVSHLQPLGQSLNEQAQHLFETVKQSNESANQVNNETQSVATAINQMLSTSQEMARNTQDAAQGANNVKHQAEQNQQLMQQTVEHTESLVSELKQSEQVSVSLSQSSAEIGSILDVIGSIADQTNLLALNAAIEAARAGEHGRGFAVVADEVRALATRTQSSTNEINKIVGQIQKGIQSVIDSNTHTQQQSSQLQSKAIQSSEAIIEILAQIENISNMTAQLASATEEQALVTEDINRNVTTISELTELSLSTNEAHSEAAQSLQTVSKDMSQTLGQFKV